MHLRRPPCPALRPFVKELWFTDEASPGGAGLSRREHSLPTGDMHIVFRLSGHPVRLIQDPRDDSGISLGFAVVGGARSGFFVKENSGQAASVGVVLRPGASLPLFDAPAGEFAERHTRLDELWGTAAAAARDRLIEEGDPDEKIRLLEGMLGARLPHLRGLHPAVAMALERFQQAGEVGEVVRRSGYSHRRFIALFQDAVGLTPKLYCRVRRFRTALERLAREPNLSVAGLAIDMGYSDQAHFHREFLAFTGMTPGGYRRIQPRFPYHVPVSKPAVR